MTDDAHLLLRYAETRAEDAFAEIVRRYVDGVYSGALRRLGGDRQLAEDVTQQVFAALARKARVVARHPVPSAWLHTTTRHEAANVVRAERRRKAREQAAFAMEALPSKTTEPVDWPRIEPLLDAALDELDEADRSAVLLRYIDRRAYAEIGVSLRVSEDAARMRVERALGKLRRILSRRGIASTSAALSGALASHAVVPAPAGLASHVVGTVLSAGFTTATGVVGIMSLNKLAAGMAAIAALVTGIGVGTQAANRSRKADAVITESQQQIAALAAKTSEARQRLQLAEQENAALEKSAGLARGEGTGATTGATASSAPPEAQDPRSVGDAFLSRHPAVKAAVADYARARVDSRYSELYRRLKLQPAQIERFRAVVSKGIGMGASDHAGASMSLSSGTFDGRELAREVTEIVGPEGLQAYYDYGLWVEPARDIATRVAMASWSTDTPLSTGRADALVELITQARAMPPPGQRMGSPFGRFDWDVLLANASRILSPAQFSALEAVRAREQLHAAYNRPVAAATVAPATTPKEGAP